MAKKILVDSNAMVILIVGLIDTNLLEKHKRTSLFDKKDFDDLLKVIGNLEEVTAIPNIWTEVDNLLNNFAGNQKYQYVKQITRLIKDTTEIYFPSKDASEYYSFSELGITDSLVLKYAKKCKLLITSDSRLSDYAIANDIKVYDLVKNKNERIEAA